MFPANVGSGYSSQSSSPDEGRLIGCQSQQDAQDWTDAHRTVPILNGVEVSLRYLPRLTEMASGKLLVGLARAWGRRVSRIGRTKESKGLCVPGFETG